MRRRASRRFRPRPRNARIAGASVCRSTVELRLLRNESGTLGRRAPHSCNGGKGTWRHALPLRAKAEAPLVGRFRRVRIVSPWFFVPLVARSVFRRRRKPEPSDLRPYGLLEDTGVALSDHSFFY